MERQFNNGDFEKLLRDNANQYRMYPSEKVWKGVYSALHTRRKWYGITAAIMFLITASIVSFIFLTDVPGKGNITEQKVIPNQSTSPTQNSSSEPKKVPFSPQVNNPIQNGAPVSDLTKTYLSNPKSIDPVFTDNSKQELTTIDQNKIAINVEPQTLVSVNEEIHVFWEPEMSMILANDRTKAQLENYSDPTIERKLGNESLIDLNTEQKISEVISALSSQNVSIIQSKKQAKLTGQFYFTPTISYRKLTENKRVYNGNGYYVPVIDIKHMVKHKPAMGFEFGLEGRYSLNDKLNLKTGFQFNISRYDVSAYSYPTEIATVALNSRSGVDSIAALSNYRNSNGYSSNWLENFYFQASFPVGAEMILSDNKKIQWGISATVQPTYLIGDKAYVISSDYKNYATYPDLMRRWNVNTGVGTFVSYSTGKIKWQVGPHFRYQHLSSFVRELTMKEKLYSFGLKVGASLSNNK